jgi:uncharacterized repeat protein (TIGR01451 family)
MGDPVGDPKIAKAKTAVTSFLNSLDSVTDRVTLSSFADTGTLDASITNNFPSITTIYNGFVANGSTNTGEGLFFAGEELETNDRGVQQAIVVFTDAHWNTGPDPFPIGDNIKLNYGIRLITVGIGPDVNPANLTALASTPSDYHYIEFADQLEETLILIARDLQGGQTDLVVTDNISQILQYADFVSASHGGVFDGTNITWNIGGGACEAPFDVSFTVRVKADAPDLSELHNNASVYDPLTTNSAISGNTLTIIHAPILNFYKTDGWDQVTPGSEVQYRVFIGNTGTGNAYEVQFIDTLPSSCFEIFPSTISDNGVYSNGVITWNNGGSMYVIDGSFAPTGSILGSEHTFTYNGRINAGCSIGSTLRNSVVLDTNRNNRESVDYTTVGTELIRTGKEIWTFIIIGIVILLVSISVTRKKLFTTTSA